MLAETMIAGLEVRDVYLTSDEQAALLKVIDAQIWMTDLKRRVQHYGWVYNYKKRSLDPSMYLGRLPSWAEEVALRLHEDGYISGVPDQLIVNEYLPGQGIRAHVDCVPCFGDTILSISLGSPCVMDFTRLKDKRRVPVPLTSGSLVVMKAEARYAWTHGIAPRMSDTVEEVTFKRGRRVSLTFRKVI